MDLQKRNKIFIDNEAFITLSMMKEGLLYPVTKLMNKKTADEVNKTKTFKGQTFPFSFILAPAGKKNEIVLQKANKNESLELYKEGELVGEIIVEEVFEIDPTKRVELIYGSSDVNCRGVAKTLKRLGKYAISGEITLFNSPIKKDIQQIKKRIKE